RCTTITTTTKIKQRCIGIIAIGDERDLFVVVEIISIERSLISILCTCANRCPSKETFVLIFLDRDIDDLIRITIFDARNRGLVAIIIDHLYLVNDIGRQFFGRGFYISSKKILTIYFYPRHAFAL